MALSSAFNTTGAAPKTINWNTQNKPTTGVLSPAQSQKNLFQNPNTQIGSVKGVLTPPVINVGGQSQVMKGSPSVIKQQQELNKLGAGLVVDGIAGDKTRAAIAKYANTPNVETPKTNTPTTNTPKAPVPSSSPMEQAQNVSTAGTQTQNEVQTQQELINKSQTSSPEYQAAIAEANRVAEARKNLENEFLQKSQNIEGTAGFLTQATGLQGQLQSKYNTGQAALSGQEASAASRLAAANAQQGLQVQAGQSAYSGAQTQAQRGLTAQTGILNAGLPTQVSPTNVPFSPLTGQYGQPASTAYGTNGLAGVGAMLNQQNQGADVQTMSSAYNMTSGLIENFNKNLQSSGFNPSPLALGNAIQAWLLGKAIPDPQYANMVNTITEIASTIAPVLGTPGNPSDLKTTLSQDLIPRLMQGQDISTVLKQLEVNAATKIQKAKETATGKPLTTPNIPSTGSSGGTGAGGSISWDDIR